MRTRLVLPVILGVLLASTAMASVSGFSYTLHARKNLMAIPAVPLNPDPAAVYGPIPIDYALIRFDSVGKGSYAYDESNPAQFGNMLLGDGYWITVNGSGNVVNYQGLTDTDSMDIWISLPRAGKSLIGNPFSVPYIWEHAKVTDGNETISLYEASQWGRNWLDSNMIWWDETGQGSRDVGVSDDGDYTDSLLPWHGYWISTKVDKLALILESPL